MGKPQRKTRERVFPMDGAAAMATPSRTLSVQKVILKGSTRCQSIFQMIPGAAADNDNEIGFRQYPISSLNDYAKVHNGVTQID